MGAAGSSSGISPQDITRMAAQDTLLPFSAWIESLPGLADSGYLTDVFDVDTSSIVLLWNGTSPLQSDIIQAGKARGIKVTIRPWAYSRKQWESAVKAIWKQSETDPAWASFHVADIVGVDLDHPGITVEGDWVSGPPSAVVGTNGSPTAAAARTAVLNASREAALAQDLGAIAPGLPTRVVSGVEPSLMVATRSNDSAPFNAGGFMRSPSSGGFCSTGFSIVYVGVRHTTTARHCRHNDYRAYNGTASYGTWMADSASGVRVLTARGSALNFDGAWNNSAGYKKKVVGMSDPGIGGYVCTSGGNSGVHCNLKVTRIASVNDGFGKPFRVKVAQQQTAGQIAAAHGDSGGPVFTIRGADVLAAGMIEAGGSNSDWPASKCGSMHVPQPCQPSVSYTTEPDVLASLGASLVTYP